MKLYAISDLHIDFEVNRREMEALPEFPNDWLILGGDICSTMSHMRFSMRVMTEKFAKVFWVPGNHELWSLKSDEALKGEAKYQALVDICREFGVVTPEDPYVSWPGPEGDYTIVPLFLLYDYSFRPDDVPLDKAIEWAVEEGVLCRDEGLLKHDPYISKAAWCHARYAYSIARMDTIPKASKLIVVNHFPLREDLIRLYRIPRFSIWCGTKLTEDLHTRYNVAAVVTGHLHMRATDYRDGVRFEEVALGYPRHWRRDRGMAHYLRQILPEPVSRPAGDAGPDWHY